MLMMKSFMRLDNFEIDVDYQIHVVCSSRLFNKAFMFFFCKGIFQLNGDRSLLSLFLSNTKLLAKFYPMLSNDLAELLLADDIM